MELTSRQIEAFRSVMMTGSMTIAARYLRITQPAVSRLIKDMEADLKFRLFRREGNRLIPTHEATVLFAEVDRFYFGFERIMKIASDLQHSKTGSLRIASIASLVLGCMTEAVKTFHADRPGVNIALESHNSRSILELVAGRHFDIGFAFANSEYPGVDLAPLPPVDAVCVVPKNYPIAAKLVLSPEDFQGIPFISLSKNGALRLKTDQWFDAAQIARQDTLEMSLASSAVELVGSGLGVSIVDPFTASSVSTGNFVIRPLRPKLTVDIHAVTPSHRQNSLLCEEFFGVVRSIFRSKAASKTGDPPTDI